MTRDQIHSEISNNDVVLFMKGTPVFPQCGFSARVASALNAEGIEFISHNVLEDELLRNNIKAYSDWPTIPQLYIKGEFAGGSDIVQEMFESGELRELKVRKNEQMIHKRL